MRISDWSSDVCSSDLPNASRDRCLATVLYQSGTQLWLGLSTDQNDLAIALANPAWTSLEVNKPYELDFDYGRGRIWKGQFTRSEERRVGKESVSTCSTRWSPYH